MKFAGKSSLIIQLVVFSSLAVTILVIWANNPPDFLGEKISNSFQSKSVGGWTSFNDSENVVVKKFLSGYWQRYIPAEMPNRPYSISDHIELKENGIFWQVKKLQLYTPDGDSSSCTEIVTGYINPFKRHDKDSNVILIDALVRGQAFATEQDTCYVNGFNNSIENQRHIISMTPETFASAIKRTGDSLFIDSYNYCGYDTTKQALSEFFPRGSVEIVDKISIPQCKRSMSTAYFVKQKIADKFSRSGIQNSDTTAIRTIIEHFYDPLVVKEMAKHYTTGYLKPMHGDISVVISVNPDGSIKQVKKKKEHVSNWNFVSQLTDEISHWKFMRQEGTTELRNVYYKFIF